MNHYFSQNRPTYPSYPPSSFENDSNQNRPPYPVGFNSMPTPSYPQSQPQYPYPPQYPHPGYGQQPNIPSSMTQFQRPPQDTGFPVAPSSFSQNYPPFQNNNQPSYPPQSHAPPPPNYQASFNTQNDFFNPVIAQPNNQFVPPPPTYQPNQPNFNQNPGGNLYPNLGQVPPPAQTPFIEKTYSPTLRPVHPFDPKTDAERLYKAMKGFGTDEATLIDVLCKRTSAQRQEILLTYKSCYGKDLIKNIESETSGNFRILLVSLLTRPIVIEAYHLRESVQGLGTDEASLIDVICTKSNKEMLELKQTYLQIYRRNLEEDVKDDVSGYFKRFLVSLMAAHRSDAPPDQQKAVQQAKELYSAGENKIGTNEVVFNKIFSNESFSQLRLIFDEYQKLTRHPIENAIRSEMSTSVQRAFLTVIQIVRNPPSYFAQRFYESMVGLGTKDKLLVRLAVLRSEIDMMDIKIEFQKKYGKSLESFIKSDCSGDYKRALLCLVGDPSWR